MALLTKEESLFFNHSVISVENESLEVESRVNDVESESSCNDSSQVSTSLESARPIKFVKILTCGNFHIQFYEAIARQDLLHYSTVNYYQICS